MRAGRSVRGGWGCGVALGVGLTLPGGASAAEGLLLSQALEDIAQRPTLAVELPAAPGEEWAGGAVALDIDGEAWTLPLPSAGCPAGADCLWSFDEGGRAGEAWWIEDLEAHLAAAPWTTDGQPVRVTLDTEAGAVVFKAGLDFARSVAATAAPTRVECIGGVCALEGSSAVIGGGPAGAGPLFIELRGRSLGRGRATVQARVVHPVGGPVVRAAEVSTITEDARELLATGAFTPGSAALWLAEAGELALALREALGGGRARLPAQWRARDAAGAPLGAGDTTLVLDVPTIIFDTLTLSFSPTDGVVARFEGRTSLGGAPGMPGLPMPGEVFFRRRCKCLGEKHDIVTVKPGFSRVAIVPADGDGGEGGLTIRADALDADLRPTGAGHRCALPALDVGGCAAGPGLTLAVDAVVASEDGPLLWLSLLGEEGLDADRDGEPDGQGAFSRLSVSGPGVEGQAVHSQAWTSFSGEVALPQLTAACYTAGARAWGCVDARDPRDPLGARPTMQLEVALRGSDGRALGSAALQLSLPAAGTSQPAAFTWTDLVLTP